MEEIEKVVEEEKVKESPKTPVVKAVKVMRLNSGRGGYVRLRSLESMEIRTFPIENVDMVNKVYEISKELWLKGEK